MSTVFDICAALIIFGITIFALGICALPIVCIIVLLRKKPKQNNINNITVEDTKNIEPIDNQIKNSAEEQKTINIQQTSTTFTAIQSIGMSTGEYGELLTEQQLMKIDIGYKKILKNVYLFKNDKYETTEIDLVMLHSTGIYVFESKNFSGWIFGNKYDNQWTQSLPGAKKYKFYNPMKQNFCHIQALKRQLNIENDDMFISYIVFSDRCELKSIPENTANTKIVKRVKLLDELYQDIKNRKIVYDNDEINKMYNALYYCNKFSAAMRNKHIKDI